MTDINVQQAQSIIDTVLAYGDDHSLKPLSVIVLDAGGHAKAFMRADGASPGRFEIAQGKAYGAVMLGMPSSALQTRAEAQAYFVAAVNGAYQGRLIPVAGGVLVKTSDGDIVGAVGVTGDSSENDAAAAIAGIEASGFKAEA